MGRILRTFVLIIVYTSTVFADSTFVSGTIVNETWTPAGSPYVMVGDLFISDLAVMPGVTIIANGDYEIEVAGLLTAVGTEQDSIVFSKVDSVDGWQGIFFSFTTFPSELKYCRIEHATNSGIRILNSTLSIENCNLMNNSGTTGGAIDFFNDTAIGSEFNLQSCTFIQNESSTHGGALRVYLEQGHLIIEDSHFENNLSNPAQSTGNYVGGAIYLENGAATVRNSDFIANRSDSRCSFGGCDVTARGGGIYVGTANTMIVNNCVFRQNRSHSRNEGNTGLNRSYGGAVYANAGNVLLNNCIFAKNTTTNWGNNQSDAGGGIAVNGGAVTLTNCTITENSDATGVDCLGGTLDVINSIIYFNNQEGTQVGGSCTVTYSNIQNGYTGEGNIDDNPVFIDSLFHLSSISPCVDSGNTDPSFNDECFPPSLGGERNDMGAYGGPGACYWDRTITGLDDDEIVNIANRYALEQNYPNPFNPTTTIRYQLPESGQVKLTVYNMLGQQVRTLVNERQGAGGYRVVWDGRNDNSITVGSGVYLYRLKANNEFVKTKKMFLIR